MSLGRSEGRTKFAAAIELGELPQAYDGLATCCRFLGALDESLAARERAYRLYRDQGDAAGATIAAAWLGRDSGLPRGEISVARSWFAVARRQVAKTDSALARGTLYYYEGQFALLGEIDAPKGGDLGALARAAGRECGDLDLEMQGLSLVGLARVAEGRVTEGMALIEEAAAAVLGGELSSADVAGWICCHLIYACERVSDTRRAAEWCTMMRGFCERWDMPGMFGMCRAHHGAVLMHEGRWAEAETEFVEASQLFADAAPALGYEALIRLCALRIRQGRLDEVEALVDMLEHTPLGWIALPSRAGLAFERGDFEAAQHLLDRYLRTVSERDRMVRADALELAVRVHLARGALEEAGGAGGALAELAADAGTERLRGAAELARGRVLAGRGDHAAARIALEDAIDLYARARAPFDLGCARAALGEVLLALGERERGRAELVAARAILDGLGANSDVARADAALAAANPTRTSDRWALSERELDVLRLAADGLSNTQIAQRLDLSAHTVHRHMANIRTKLGGESKAAVVARATREGLI
jgi:DNA-binding CsgD family transcriptional regulator